MKNLLRNKNIWNQWHMREVVSVYLINNYKSHIAYFWVGT